MLEKDIQLQIIHYLKAKGYVVGKTKTVGIKRGRSFCFDPYCFRGHGDLEAFKDGIMYSIEVKSETGKLSPAQEEYRKLFHYPPSRIYIEAHSLDDVIAKISQIP